INLTIDGRAELGFGHAVSGRYFPVLGVPAAAGRTLLPSDDVEHAPAVAVISHSLWTRRFQRAADMTARSVAVNGVRFEIVGVMPPGFRGTGQVDDAPEIYVPFSAYAEVTRSPTPVADPTYWWVLVMGRLHPGVEPPQAAATL